MRIRFISNDAKGYVSAQSHAQAFKGKEKSAQHLIEGLGINLKRTQHLSGGFLDEISANASILKINHSPNGKVASIEVLENGVKKFFFELTKKQRIKQALQFGENSQVAASTSYPKELKGGWVNTYHGDKGQIKAILTHRKDGSLISAEIPQPKGSFFEDIREKMYFDESSNFVKSETIKNVDEGRKVYFSNILGSNKQAG